MDAHNLLIYLNRKYEGNWNKIYDAVKAREKVTNEEVNKATDGLKMDATVLVENEYPERFKQIYKPPFVLYHLGNFDLLNEKSLAVIGNGEYSDEINDLVMDLSNKCTIITSLKSEFEKELVNSLVKHNKKFILVVDSYDELDKNSIIKQYLVKNGLILSEFGFEGHKNNEDIKYYSRILSAGAKGIFIPCAENGDDRVESAVLFGTTVGSDVYCMPSSKKDSLPNSLIKQGAYLANSINDFNDFVTC